MKILFTDPVDGAHLTRLGDDGHTWAMSPGPDLLDDTIGDFDVVVVGPSGLTASSITAGKRLGLIVSTAAEPSTIDVAAASKAGILVSEVSGGDSASVAELALGLMLALDRGIVSATNRLRSGQWDRGPHLNAAGLKGSRLGIVGLGRVGLEVAERAKALGMVVSSLRRSDRPEPTANRIRRVGIRLAPSLTELLADSDIVSIHVPGNDSTARLVDAAFVADMAPGAMLINTSHGSVLDEDEVLRAVRYKGLRVGLDAHADSPNHDAAPWSSELIAHPNVIGTPQIGSTTRQAREAVAEGIVDTILAFAGGHAINTINLASEPLGAVTLCVRHADRVGVLAEIFESIRAGGINVARMTNRVFVGGATAVATMELASEVPPKLIDQLALIEDVFAVSQTPIGS